MDVVEGILARLDAEDVVRCKRVCKSWYDLISSNYFVKAHLKHSYNSNREHGYLRIQLNLRNKSSYFLMVGSCNGLVCICISRNLGEYLVINPWTREARKLPVLPYKDLRIRKVCWGFGYDSCTDDYKVVVGVYESEDYMRFQVLSFKSNKWNFIGDGDYSTYNNRFRGFLYDGSLHWFMNDLKKEKTIILSFDLSQEKFKEIQLPDDSVYVCDNNHNVLGMFEECLCIIGSYDFKTNHCQTWVMKNYNRWQLLPCDYEGNKYAAATTAYILDSGGPDNTWRFCVDAKGNVDLSWKRWYHIGAPIFVKSLVSPWGTNQRKRRITRG